MTTLRTPRLDLTPVSTADADELLAFFNDPDVGRYLLDGEPVSREWVDGEIAASVARFTESGCGLWAVRLRDGATAGPDAAPRGSTIGIDRNDQGARGGDHFSGTLAGIVGFRPFFEPPELQLVYALHPSAWGRGLATEAARAAMQHAFGVLGFDEIQAATDEPNRASIAVMERLGMEPGRIEEGQPHRTLFYRVRRANWTEEPPPSFRRNK